uniref:SERPIN domain-containing protein n=1 Tax=Globodera pallida TaxID=36090 RepID=A0A183C082_GLOPA
MSLNFNLALIITAVLQVLGIQFNGCFANQQPLTLSAQTASEFNAEELCRPIEGTSYHGQCLLSEVVKQKGFIPKHLRPPWLDSKLFEDNELPADKATGDGCYACYKGTKASNGVNPGEEYCACTYKKQALNVKFGKIFGTFDFGNTTCIQDFHKMTLMPKCGSDYYEHVKHCAMVHFYDNDPDKEPRNTEHKRTLVLLDGCIITGGAAAHKNCTANVNIAFEQKPKSSFFYGTCDAEMKTVFESTIELKAFVATASDKLADANKVTNAAASSSFAFPVEFKHRICKGLFGSDDADDAFENITMTISGDCGTKSFKLPTLEFEKGCVQEMRGLQLDLRGNAVMQWRDALGGYAFAKKARLLWQPSELKSLNAYGLVNVALMYPNLVDHNPVGQAEFSMDLLKAVYRNRAEGNPAKNTVLSPLSAAIALAMAYAGARGQTAAEFGKVLAGGSTLHINFGKFFQEIASNQINDALKRNNLQSDGPPPEFKLRIANRVYLANTFNVLDEFKLVINTHYGGNFESIDFEQNVAAAEKINAFVENATNGKIKDLQMTEKLTFFITNGQESKLDMMQTQNQFIYVEENNFKMLGMPYVGEKAHLFILLPNANDGLENLLNELKGAKLMELIENSATTEVKVILPKFKIESSHQLADVLASLGIKSAFQPNADFSGISNTTLPLCINKVIQKAMISLDEDGTEAAAATAVVLFSPISPVEDVVPPPPPTFRADHPFAFFLIYSQKQHVMFSGVFMGDQ